VALCFLLVLRSSGVSGRAVLLFLAAQAFGYAFPGMLTWRVLRGGRDPGIVDLVFGTITFHALSVPWYLLVRWAGVPHLVWALPIVAIVVAAVIGRRQGLGLIASEPMPAWCAWNGAAAIIVGITLIGVQLPVASGRGVRWQGTDNPFLLSLAGELKHHLPAVMPFVTGVRLDYHWFTFADIAGGSWLGGQELDLLVFSLMPLALLAIGLASFGLLGWRLTGRPAAGVVAVWLAVLVGSVNPLGGFDGYVTDSTFLRILWTVSVTQGYAQVLTVGLMYVVVDLLRGRGGQPWVLWGLFVVTSFVISGAKSSFIPVVGAGVLLTVVVAWRKRRRWKPVLLMGLVLAAELVFAQVVLFGGASQGLKFGPRASVERVATYGGIAELGPRGLVVMVVFLLVGWFLPMIAIGVWALRSERHRVVDDLVPYWVLGMVVSGVLAALLMTHPGLSQYSFLRAGLCFGYLGVAAGLVRLWELVSPRVRWAGVLAVPLGIETCIRLRAWTHPVTSPDGVHDLERALGATLVVVVLVAAIAAVGARRGGRVAASLLVTGAFTVGMGATRTVDLANALGEPRPGAVDIGISDIPAGGIQAARFVRDQSDPSAIVATNAHCRFPAKGPCVTTAHWMSAWTERRFVVEGWGYTPIANASGDTMGAVVTSPFWDPALLALNDRVFLHPSAEALAALQRRFPVQWLLVDTRFRADLAGLEQLLPVHRRFGQTYVFDASRR
jgi:hypothetical protein